MDAESEDGDSEDEDFVPPPRTLRHTHRNVYKKATYMSNVDAVLETNGFDMNDCVEVCHKLLSTRENELIANPMVWTIRRMTANGVCWGFYETTKPFTSN